MVGNKTGGLFRLAVRLMQAESATDLDLTPLVSLLGLQFQICDDYLNLEGKFSFPVLHRLHADPTNKELLAILRQKPRDLDIKKYGRIEGQGDGVDR